MNLKPRDFRLALLAWAGLVLLLSVLPMPAPPLQTFLLSDKLLHAAFYLPLATLGFWALSPRSPASRFALATAGALLYGAFIELLQAFLPYRSCEFADIIADLVGALTGSLLALILRKLVST